MSPLCPFVFPPSLLLLFQCSGIHISAEVGVCKYGWKRDGTGELCVSLGFPWDRGAIKPVCSPVGEERNKAKCQRQMASVIATCATGPTTKTLRVCVCVCWSVCLCRWVCLWEKQCTHMHIQSLCCHMSTHALENANQLTDWHKKKGLCVTLPTWLDFTGSLR